MDEYIACICEGDTEQAIIELLLENNSLKFEKKNLLDEKVLRTRAAKKFEEQHLRKQFNKPIKVYRILDSRTEKFKLGRAYEKKVAEIVNIITAPEIEMLIIFNEDTYEDYKKSKKKPSAYCKEDLNYKNIKQPSFIKEYFSDVNTLITAIKLYRDKKNIPKDEKTLFDLLRECYFG